jgi:hypothetical protein
MRVRLALTLLFALALVITAGPVHAQDPADPSPSPEGATLPVGHPRAAVLTLVDSATESFLLPGKTTADAPLTVTAPAAVLYLAADYEAVFLPLTAGWAHFALAAVEITSASETALADDRAEVVAFGPARRAGRMVLRLGLTPGLHQIRLVAETSARAVGVAEWTTDRDSALLWVLVPRAASRGTVVPVATPEPSPTPGAPLALEAAGAVRVNLVGPVPVVAPIDVRADVDPSPLPASGVSVGAQRGIVGRSALGAVNFAAGQSRIIVVRTGEPVRVWSDYDLWIADRARGSAVAALTVRARPLAGAVDTAPLGEDRFALDDAVGPRRASGTLAVTFAFDQPGTYPLLAELVIGVKSGDRSAQDRDTVPLTVQVVGVPPRTGSISGVVYGADGLALPGVDVDAVDDAGSVGATARTAPDGRYRIEAVEAGAWRVHARPGDLNYLGRWWDGKMTFREADPVPVRPGEDTPGINFKLTPGGTITGRVTDVAGAGLGGIEITAGWLRNVPVPVDPATPGDPDPREADLALARTKTNDDGDYSLDHLPAGVYWVRAADPTGRHVTEYYDDKPTLGQADKVPVATGKVTAGIDFALAKADGRARVHVDPAQAGVRLGQSGRVAIAVARVADLGAFEVALAWDPAILRVDGVAIGPFLGSTGRQVVPVEPQIDNATGRARFAAASLGDAPGPQGAGVLCTVTFTGFATGTTPFEVAQSVLTTPTGAPIDHDRTAGRITVGDCMVGDFDCNCVIDIRDVMAVVRRWGTVAGDGRYDGQFDLDHDADIDIVDVQIEASLWGRRCDGPVPAGHAPGGADAAGVANARDGDAAGDTDTAAGSAGRTAAPLAPRLSLAATPAEASVGEKVTVVTGVSDAGEVAGFEVRLAYDPSRLRFTGAAPGAFLARTGRTVVPLGPLADGAAITFGAFSLPGAPAPEGAGELATFTFEVLAAGEATIEVTDATLIDPLEQATSAGGAAATVSVPGSPRAATVHLPIGLRPRE